MIAVSATVPSKQYRNTGVTRDGARRTQLSSLTFSCSIRHSYEEPSQEGPVQNWWKFGLYFLPTLFHSGALLGTKGYGQEAITDCDLTLYRAFLYDTDSRKNILRLLVTQ
jgi:hypothetical protein